MMNPGDKPKEPKMDPADLYREEVFTDRGSTDAGRQTLYLGQAQVLTAVGAVPLSFEIDASSLEGAIEKFSEAAKEAVDRTVKELQEIRREATSPIVVPGSGVGGPGGLPGGGVIPRP